MPIDYSKWDNLTLSSDEEEEEEEEEEEKKEKKVAASSATTAAVPGREEETRKEEGCGARDGALTRAGLNMKPICRHQTPDGASSNNGWPQLMSIHPGDLQNITLGQVRNLPPARHIWSVDLEERNSRNFILVQDETDGLLQQGAKDVKNIIVCPCQPEDILLAYKIIFNGMADPCPRIDLPSSLKSYGQPQRPRFLLLSENYYSALSSESYAKLKAMIELTGVPVRIGSDIAKAEAIHSIEKPIHPRSTYLEGYKYGTTAALAKQLPLVEDEVWKITLYEGDGFGPDFPSGHNLLVIENVSSDPVTMIGQGPISGIFLNEPILATMQSPVCAPRSSLSESKPGTPRRPGLLLLELSVQCSLEHIQDALLGSEVKVMVHNAESNICGNLGCFRVDKSYIGLGNVNHHIGILDCPCKLVSYCSKECQIAHWKDHKVNCLWHEENQAKKKKKKKGKQRRGRNN